MTKLRRSVRGATTPMWKRILEKLFAEPKDPDAEKRAAYKAWQRQQNADRVLILARVISGNDPAVMSPVELSIHDPTAFVRMHGHEHPNPKSAADVSPFWAALNALERNSYAGGIDWRSDADELIAALNPVLERRQINNFDWSFINELIAAEDSESLRNDNLLLILGRKIAERGFILAWINTLGDNYEFTVLTPEQFAQIDSLKGTDFYVDRFE